MIGRIRLFGINIDNLSFQESLNKINDFIKTNSKHYIVTPNVDHLIRLQTDDGLRKAYANASLILADGMPLIWASMLLGKKLKERITGADLFQEICKIAEKNGYSIFMLGARAEVINLASINLKRLYPELIISGTYHGFFTEEENIGIINIINSLSPHFLFIGMGSPKQELWVLQNLHKLNIKVTICVGGTFEIIAGCRKRAPRWMQKIGIEWSWRLMQEPRRLWKRYLVDDMMFWWLLIKELWKVRIQKGY